MRQRIFRESGREVKGSQLWWVDTRLLIGSREQEGESVEGHFVQRYLMYCVKEKV